MKKRSFSIILLGISTSILADTQVVSGRSFMFTRPASYHLHIYHQLWHNLMNNKQGCSGGGIQVTPFHQQSTAFEPSDTYFLFHCKQQLTVAGDAVVTAQRISADDRDIRAEWLGLSDDFYGTFTVHPEQKQTGITFEYHQDIGSILPIPFLHDTWLSASLPIIAVENRINLTECILQAGSNSTAFKSITTALNNPAWKHAKFGSKEHKVLPAELRLALGRSFLSQHFMQIGYYSLLVIPTGNKQKNETIFEPIVGNNQHVSFGGAAHIQVGLNRNPDTCGWSFFANLEALFRTRNKQLRTFDLQKFTTRDNVTALASSDLPITDKSIIRKPWSRYLPFVRKGDLVDRTYPGTDVLTLKTVVRPYGLFDFSAGWRFHAGDFEGEVGYNIWGYDEETLELCCDIDDPCCWPACEGQFGLAGDFDVIPRTKTGDPFHLGSTIGHEQTNNDDVFIPITKGDIDLKSAAAASAITHKIHVALGWNKVAEPCSGMFGGGFFVDIPQKNSALKTWGAWCKVGATY